METQARRVLSVYKKILRSGRNWDEQRERDYISSEAKRLFRVNKDLHNQEYELFSQFFIFSPNSRDSGPVCAS